MQKDEKKKVRKQTSAEKRIIQSEKRRQRNRAAKARVQTSVRTLLTSIKEQQKEKTTENLNVVFSLLDKSLKNGILKKNRVNRVKSKLAKKAHLSQLCA